MSVRHDFTSSKIWNLSRLFSGINDDSMYNSWLFGSSLVVTLHHGNRCNNDITYKYIQRKLGSFQI